MGSDPLAWTGPRQEDALAHTEPSSANTGRLEFKLQLVPLPMPNPGHAKARSRQPHAAALALGGHGAP